LEKCKSNVSGPPAARCGGWISYPFASRRWRVAMSSSTKKGWRLDVVDMDDKKID
jgi:hypothetical protein